MKNLLEDGGFESPVEFDAISFFARNDRLAWIRNELCATTRTPTIHSNPMSTVASITRSKLEHIFF